MEIKVYSIPTCPYCIKAKEYLASKGVKYQGFDVSQENRPIAAPQVSFAHERDDEPRSRARRCCRERVQPIVPPFHLLCHQSRFDTAVRLLAVDQPARRQLKK